MTDPHDLARAMVALLGWRPLVGMVVLPGRSHRGGIIWRTDGHAVCDIIDADGNEYRVGGPLPDLSNGAALGAIEHGLLAPAGVWVERMQTVTHRIAYIARTADGTIAAGPVPMLEHYRDSLPAALLDGLRAVAS